MATKKKSAKSSVKKSVKSASPLSNHAGTMRAIISLLIIMLAASVFVLFRTYQDNIVQNNMFYPFMTLTVVMMALLVSLLFLMNPAKKK